MAPSIHLEDANAADGAPLTGNTLSNDKSAKLEEKL
jgi:hypothetical protein